MSEALDLERFPDGEYPVGWLGSSVPATGPTPEECIERLFDAYTHGLCLADGSLGWHNCEICSTRAEWYPGDQIGPVIRWKGQELRLYGHGHYLVQHEGRVYVCPALILHYILDHGYRPPDEFVRAVTQGCFLTRNHSAVHEQTGGVEAMEILDAILVFLDEIRLPTSEGLVPPVSVLPGIQIVDGILVYHRGTLRWPGDLLHEAGHIAVTPAALRSVLNDALESSGAVPHASEVEATAWAYAATVHLQLHASVLFHDGGYHGHAAGLIATFSSGV